MSDKVFLTQSRVAEILKVKPRTLQTWRYRKIGPPFYDLGGIKYEESELNAWIESRRSRSRSSGRSDDEASGE